MCKYGINMCNSEWKTRWMSEHFTWTYVFMSYELWNEFWAIDLKWQGTHIGWRNMNDGNDQQNIVLTLFTLYFFCILTVNNSHTHTLQCNLEFNCEWQWRQNHNQTKTKQTHTHKTYVPGINENKDEKARIPATSRTTDEILKSSTIVIVAKKREKQFTHAVR